MKKILLYSTLALGVGLCSCSQEDLGENPAQAVGQPVTVSVQLPGEVGSDGLSRAVPEIPADHQLRCILYVSGGDAEPIRQEVVADEASDVITFSFTPPADTYTCSFWADYVKTDANSDGTYDDLYYNTTNLPNVTFADNADLFNNEACDAFTGHFTQDEITSGTPVTLSRPLAKVNFVAKEDISGNVSVTSGYTVSNGMNISTGAVSTTTATLSCTDKAVADAEGNVLFYNYLFAAERPGQRVHTCRQREHVRIRLAPQGQRRRKVRAQSDHGKRPGMRIFQDLQFLLPVAPGGHGVTGIHKPVHVDSARKKERNRR